MNYAPQSASANPSNGGNPTVAMQSVPANTVPESTMSYRLGVLTEARMKILVREIKRMVGIWKNPGGTHRYDVEVFTHDRTPVLVRLLTVDCNAGEYISCREWEIEKFSPAMINGGGTASFWQSSSYIYNGLREDRLPYPSAGSESLMRGKW